MPQIKEKNNPFAVYVLAGTVFLLPLFFVMPSYLSVGTAKTAFLCIALAIGLGTWTYEKAMDGKIRIKRPVLLTSCVIVLLAMLVSYIHSSAPVKSFWGYGGETGTVFFTILLFLTLFLSSLYIKNRKAIELIARSFLTSSAVALTLYLFKLLLHPRFLAFSTFKDPYASFIGSVPDVAIFAGLTILVVLSAFDFYQMRKGVRIVLGILLAESVAILAILGISRMWWLMLAASLMFIVARAMLAPLGFAKNEGMPQQIMFPFGTLLVFLASFIFILLGQPASAALQHIVGLAPYIFDRPFFSATYTVFKAVLLKHIVLGIGPNRFDTAWYVGAKASVSPSAVLPNGYGYLLPMMSTLGLLGVFAWVFFIETVFYKITAALVTKAKAKKYGLVSATLPVAIIAVYLWLTAAVLNAGPVILFLAFLGMGICVGTLLIEDSPTYSVIEFFSKSQRYSKYASVAVAIIIIAIPIFVFEKKVVAYAYFQKGADEIASNDPHALSDIVKSFSIAQTDASARALAAIELGNLATLVSQPFDRDTSGKKFQDEFNISVQAALASSKFDDADYRNYLSYGDLYSFLVPLNFSKAYEKSRDAYEAAAALYPNNADIYVSLARLELADSSMAGSSIRAAQYANKALSLRPEYSDAEVVLVEAKAASGDTDGALALVNDYLAADPVNYALMYEKGAALYAAGRYKEAVPVFESLIAYDSQQSNAKYLLAVSYYKSGRSSDAIAMLASLASVYPDNAEVTSVLANMKSGKELFEAPLSKNATSTAQDSTTTIAQ